MGCRMSTRCQIEFRRGEMRRTVYRHSDGYPSAVIEDLLAFLQWSVRGGDVEYEAANFLYSNKREIAKRLPGYEQLGFAICSNDELHGDVEYYYALSTLPRVRSCARTRSFTPMAWRASGGCCRRSRCRNLYLLPSLLRTRWNCLRCA